MPNDEPTDFVAMRKYMNDVARTLCNDLTPDKDDWAEQIHIAVESEDGVERYVQVYMAGVGVARFEFGTGGCMPEGFGKELATAFANAGPIIFNLLARVVWLEGHIARTMKIQAEMMVIKEHEIAALKELFDAKVH